MCGPFEDDKPVSFSEALSWLTISEWIAAKRHEINLKEKNPVWKLVGLLSGGKSIRNKWV